MPAMAVSPLFWAPVALALLCACGAGAGGTTGQDAKPSPGDAPVAASDLGGGPGGADSGGPSPSADAVSSEVRRSGDGRMGDGRAPDGGGGAAADRAGGLEAIDCLDAPRDAPRDMASPRDSRPDGMDPGHCSPGNSCTRGSMCQRSCLGGRLDTCRCSDGRYYCTGCVSVDGGGGDARDFPNCSGNMSVDGRRCDSAGAICDYPGADGMKRLCVCGSAGGEMNWVCQ